ncbi:hypothetical protein GIB67_011393 [Kingdonia uniflora]|uniref:F-box associated beta-propeller type 3 domain-containing protein n=1 Tax=Kingdonia uniflora TaxID=39325 RepID=A0A7J7M3R7_9MAGN|nr:hypothetical protein GIB67_011393 [Kingdonia uniflora]
MLRSETYPSKPESRSKLYSLDYRSCDYIVELSCPLKSPCSTWDIEYVGSCNGLVCIIPDNEDIAYLWNPSTREYKRLPDNPYAIPDNFGFGNAPIVYGFGYDRVVENYKVVRMVSLYNDFSDEENYSEVSVYSLGLDLWRRVSNVPYESYFAVSGEFVSGALHWVVSDWSKQEGSIIVAFDISNEEFREIPEPEPEYRSGSFLITVRVYEGELCLICNYDDICVDVWVMKDYGIKGSWIKLFKFDQHTTIQSFVFVIPLCVSKSSEVLMVKDGKTFILYDPKRKRASNLTIRGLPDWFCAITYLETLVSLDTQQYSSGDTSNTQAADAEEAEVLALHPGYASSSSLDAVFERVIILKYCQRLSFEKKYADLSWEHLAWLLILSSWFSSLSSFTVLLYIDIAILMLTLSLAA